MILIMRVFAVSAVTVDTPLVILVADTSRQVPSTEILEEGTLEEC